MNRLLLQKCGSLLVCAQLRNLRDYEKISGFTRNPFIYTLSAVEDERLELFRNLMNEGLVLELIEYLLSQHTQISITKINSRSVLGSMNDLTFQIKSMIYIHGGLAESDLSEMTNEMHRTQMSAIKYHVAIDEVKRRLIDAHE